FLQQADMELPARWQAVARQHADERSVTVARYHLEVYRGLRGAQQAHPCDPVVEHAACAPAHGRGAACGDADVQHVGTDEIPRTAFPGLAEGDADAPPAVLDDAGAVDVDQPNVIARTVRAITIVQHVR